MSLLTDELRKELPRLYSQQGNNNPMIYAKFFLPATGWTWYITEGEQEDDEYIFYGYVFGLEEEWGYTALSELEGLRNRMRLSVERDDHFIPRPWNEVKQRHYTERGMSA